ncbi:MAG: helix-turn-helix domain-containing protein [Thermaerobacter sp.]|nr:helix-turn-helix domain-containing protein [Thermaerobacter sp.]
MRNLQDIACPIHRAATLVADVTVIVILRELRNGPRRFGELLVPGMNPRSLSDRLRRLTHEDVITRTRYAEVPPRVEYSLTPKGVALLPVLQALQDFGQTWLPVEAVPGPATAADQG